MAVRLAKTAGFCMGVKRAVDMVLDMAQQRGEVRFYTYGPLIHNPQTVELLGRRGIVPIDRLDDIDPAEGKATVIIRAHGISPQERRMIRERGFTIIDATCPKVAYVQAIIKKHASRAYTILIVGDSDHPEVNGLLGYAGDRGIVVSNRADVARLPAQEKVCVVAQTTQSLDDYEQIVADVRARFPETVVFDTICDSTEKRQAEVKALAAEMDAMVIIGGRNSANTKRLAELASHAGAPTLHIETVQELEGMDINRFDQIGISAGASTPNWIIDRVVDGIRNRHGGRNPLVKRAYDLWVFLVRSDIYAALGAASLSFTSMVMQGLPVRLRNILTTALYVFAMHTLNRVINRKTSTILGSFREESYSRHRQTYLTVAVAAMLMALSIAFVTGWAAFALLLLISVLGMLYNVRIWPRWRFESLRDLPGSKNLSMAAAWAAVAAVLPHVELGLAVTPGLVMAFLFVFFVVFIRSAMSDMLDIQSDRLLGQETIPVLIGKERTQKLLNGIMVGLAFLMLFFAGMGWSSSLNIALLSSLFYLWICFKLCDRRAWFSGVSLEGFLETSYLVAGMATLLWWFGGTAHG